MVCLGSFEFKSSVGKKKNVLSFGDGECGKLGHGDRERQLLPKVIEKLRGIRVAAIIPAGNGRHSMVRIEGGTILSFGCGESGELGRGKHHVRDWRTLDPDRDEVGEDPRTCALTPCVILGPPPGAVDPDEDSSGEDEYY